MTLRSTTTKKRAEQVTKDIRRATRRHYKVRPKKDVAHPENTDKNFCLYHQTHGDYTYSQAWGTGWSRLLKAR